MLSSDGLDAQIAEIDENLVRQVLSPAATADLIGRRKALYVAVHPEAAYEARPGRAGKSRQAGDNSADRFTSATSKATGKSERVIQRAATRNRFNPLWRGRWWGS